MKYDILELNTNVKPTFLKHLLARHDLSEVIYSRPRYPLLLPAYACF